MMHQQEYVIKAFQTQASGGDECGNPRSDTVCQPEEIGGQQSEHQIDGCNVPCAAEVQDRNHDVIRQVFVKEESIEIRRPFNQEKEHKRYAPLFLRRQRLFTPVKNIEVEEDLSDDGLQKHFHGRRNER